MEIISLNGNKLKVIYTQINISYNKNILTLGGGLIREGGLIHFSTQKGGLLERGLI